MTLNLELQLAPETVSRLRNLAALEGVNVEDEILTAINDRIAATEKEAKPVQFSSDPKTRNAQIRALALAPEAVQVATMQASQEAAEAYYASEEGEDEFADWRALDGEPFHE